MTDSCDFELKKTKCMQKRSPPPRPPIPPQTPRSLAKGSGACWRGVVNAQSVNLWQAFFQRQAVHHMSRFSIPYTLRHFFPSPRTFRLRAVVALGGDERTAMVWERCSPKPWLLLGDTVFPVKVTGGDCQEMLKLELLVGVKLVEEELLLLDGMDTGAVAW